MVLVVSSVQKLSLIEGTSKQGIVSKFSFYYSWVPNKHPPPPRLLMFELPHPHPHPTPPRLFIIPNIFLIVEIDDLNTKISISKFQ